MQEVRTKVLEGFSRVSEWARVSSSVFEWAPSGQEVVRTCKKGVQTVAKKVLEGSRLHSNELECLE